jgi:ribonuclease-3
LQSRGYDLPLYQLTQIEGEAHRQTFTAECRIPVLDIATIGSSGSRRKAEQDAAAKAFEQVMKHV